MISSTDAAAKLRTDGDVARALDPRGLLLGEGIARSERDSVASTPAAVTGHVAISFADQRDVGSTGRVLTGRTPTGKLRCRGANHQTGAGYQRRSLAEVARYQDWEMP